MSNQKRDQKVYKCVDGFGFAEYYKCEGNMSRGVDIFFMPKQDVKSLIVFLVFVIPTSCWKHIHHTYVCMYIYF